jgi:hypothetical protein
MTPAHTLLILLVILSAGSAQAHLEGGADKVVDGYLIDFGFSPETPTARDSVIFSINLVDNETKQPVAVESAWLRIATEDRILFAGTLHPNQGNVSLSQFFFEKGEYEVAIRFDDSHEETIVQSVFDVSVVENPHLQGGNIVLILVYAIIFVVGMGMIVLLILPRFFKGR